MLKLGSKKDHGIDYKCTIRMLDDNEVLECEFQVRRISGVLTRRGRRGGPVLGCRLLYYVTLQHYTSRRCANRHKGTQGIVNTLSVLRNAVWDAVVTIPQPAKLSSRLGQFFSQSLVRLGSQ